MPLEVKTYEAPALLGELLLYELNPEYCRDTVAIEASENDLPMGTVMVANADGTFGAWAVTDTDAAGVLLCDVPASGAAAAAPLVRRVATVSRTALRWPEGATDEQKSAALAALEANGVIAR